jgi:hypothetical protein
MHRKPLTVHELSGALDVCLCACTRPRSGVVAAVLATPELAEGGVSRRGCVCLRVYVLSGEALRVLPRRSSSIVRGLRYMNDAAIGSAGAGAPIAACSC